MLPLTHAASRAPDASSPAPSEPRTRHFPRADAANDAPENKALAETITRDLARGWKVSDLAPYFPRNGANQINIVSKTGTNRLSGSVFSFLRNDKLDARSFFDAVERGEVVRVFRNGKPIADIVPVASETPSWKRRTAQPLVVKGVSMSAEILKDRIRSRA